MEELISRADVEQTVEDNILCYTHSDKPQDPDTECHMAIRMALRMLMKDLKKLPSAQPKRIRGRWITDKQGYVTCSAICNKCGERTKMLDGYYNFCPHCGMKMEK